MTAARDGIVMAMVSETLRLSSEEREQLAAAACRFGTRARRSRDQRRRGVIEGCGASRDSTPSQPGRMP